MAETCEQARDRLHAEVAECHDLVALLWSLTDPDIIAEAAGLTERVHSMLGVNDPDGKCGNEVCAHVTDLEARLAACQTLIEQWRQRANFMNAQGGNTFEMQAHHREATTLFRCAEDLAVLLKDKP